MSVEFFRRPAVRDYRSFGVMFDSSRKPYGTHSGQRWTLVVSLWWVDLVLEW